MVPPLKEVTRRTFLKAAAAASLASPAKSLGTSLPLAQSQLGPIGEWSDDPAGLPCYQYLGPVPFVAPPEIKSEYLLDDPFFLLGNYHLTLFVHASGHYQILTGERAWGRLNQGDQAWSGVNDASIEVGGQRLELVGRTSSAAAGAKKIFGVGYASYQYSPIANLNVTRTLSVLPSKKPGDGCSAFVVSVQLHNSGDTALNVLYKEGVRAAYSQIFAPWDADQHLVAYTKHVAIDSASGEARCDFQAHEPRPLLFSRGRRMSRFEGAPPSLFLRLLATPSALKAAVITGKDSDGHDRLALQAESTLAPSQQTTVEFIVGYAFHKTDVADIAGKLTAALGSSRAPHFQQEWSRSIPSLNGERDSNLRREMRWNAAVLEQMATYREYYDETVVPQGTVYDYQWGLMASSRDLAQHALPLCHTNPALARSVLRFIMKRTLPDGEIKLDDTGFGWSPHGPRLTSDQQLYFFLLLNEYLRATGDASILTEQVSYYPVECAGQGTGLDHVRDAFLFLRERIGVGSHGLVKLWNSDWNDMFFFWPTTIPYNNVFSDSESHMNSAMAVVILRDLASMLELHAHKSSGDAEELLAAIREYRKRLLDAFLLDWGGHPFPKRMYFGEGRPVGETDMWLEPQGFTLLIPELPVLRKQALLAEIHQRLIKGAARSEALGAKQMEMPLKGLLTPAGSREDGGFWYALNGPLILGVASFNSNSANEMLRKMSFANYSNSFPRYWTGQWSASDSLDSASLSSEGLSTFIPYCAHAHAWPLYCYLRLKEVSK